MEMYTVSVYDAVTGDDEQDSEVFTDLSEAQQFAEDLYVTYVESDWAVVDVCRFKGEDQPLRAVFSPPGYGNEHVIVLDVSYAEIES